MDEWEGLYDPTNPVHRSIARVAGFDPEAPTPESLERFMRGLLLYIDVEHRIGYSGLNRLTEPVVDTRLKFKKMSGHVREDRSWVSVETVLDIPWDEQVRVIANGHPTPLIAWDEDRQIECEWAIRSGMSIHKVAERFELPYHQARKLVRMFRGPE